MELNSISSINSTNPPNTAVAVHGEGTVHLFNDKLNLAFNLVGGVTDKAPAVTSASWGELRADLLFRIPIDQIRDAKDGPAWIPATFKDQGAGRNQENIAMLTCIVLDVDHGLQFDDATKRLKEWGHEAALHTSYSHTTEDHRFRIVLPLATPIDATQAKPLFDLMQAMFDSKIDPACLEVSRLFYLPSCPTGSEGHFRYEHVPGRLLRLADASDGISAGRAPEPGSVPDARDLVTTDMGFPSATPGSRHTILTKIIGSLLTMGNDDHTIMTACNTWNASLAEPLPEAEVDKAVRDICAKHERAKVDLQTSWDNVVDSMNSKYAWLTNPMAIYRFQSGAIVSGPTLNMQYANRKVAITTGGSTKNATHYEAWLQSPNRREHDDLTFQPGQPSIVGNCVNLWKAWGANPAAGDAGPWSELLDFIFGAGTAERRWIEQWFAYPLQYPGTKLKSCVVIWSTEQGVGKSMLGNTVGKLYGRHSKTITAKELHSNFNGWARESLFVMGEENSSGDHRADSNKLKELITGDTVYVEEKYQPSTECPNQMNFMFTSNHPDAFHLETADRRYFIWSIDKPPLAGSFYDSFIAWRESESGLPALMAHLLAVDLTGFDPHANPPMTVAKLEMKDMSKTELERWVGEALDDHMIDEVFCSEVMATQELVKLYQRDTGAVRCNDTAMIKAIRRQTSPAKRRVVSKKTKISVISLRNHEHWGDQPDAEWVTELNKHSSIAAI